MNPLGSTNLFQQPSRYGWSPERGYWAEWDFEAAGETGKLNIRALGAQLAAGNVQYAVSEEFGKARLTAQFGTDPNVPQSQEIPITSWNAQTNRVPKELYSIGQVFAYQNTAAVGGYPITVVGGLKNALQVLRSCVNATSLDDATAAGITRPTAPTPTTWINWFRAYDLLIGGTTEQVVEQTVIIRTLTASANYARTILQSNTGKIFTPAQMASIESCPATLIETVALPTGLTAYDAGTPGDGFLYGYRKGKPDMQSQAFNKWSVTTQWEQGIWAMFLYDPAT